MDFSRLINYLEQRDKNLIPDCRVVVYKDHECLLDRSFACSDVTESEKNKDMYYLFSASKVITCTSALRLVEDGKLGIDDPVSKYLPEFAELYIIKDVKKVPAKNTLTVRHLFSMQGGLTYNLGHEEIQKIKDATDNKATTREIMRGIAKMPLSFEPGTNYQYSLCHDVLAAVIERISGLSFAESMRKEIFDPLGMENTSFAADDRMAPQYALNWDTREIHPHTLTCDYRLAPGYFSGGAGIVSTLDDLSVFLDALACGKSADGYRLLKDETIRQMQREQLSSIAKDPSFGCSSGPGYGYGLGVRTLVDNSQGQKSPLGEFGWDGAAGCYALCDPKNGLSIAFTTQVLGWVGVPGMSHAPIRDGVYEALSL